MTRRTLFTLLSSLPLASFADPELDLDDATPLPDILSVRIEGIADLLLDTNDPERCWLIFYGSRYNRVVPLKYGPDESGNIVWSTRGEGFMAPSSPKTPSLDVGDLAYVVPPLSDPPLKLGGTVDETIALIDKMQKERK